MCRQTLYGEKERAREPLYAAEVMNLSNGSFLPSPFVVPFSPHLVCFLLLLLLRKEVRRERGNRPWFSESGDVVMYTTFLDRERERERERVRNKRKERASLCVRERGREEGGGRGRKKSFCLRR